VQLLLELILISRESMVDIKRMFMLLLKVVRNLLLVDSSRLTTLVGLVLPPTSITMAT